METYLSGFKEIKQFQASVESARKASIHIYFTKEHQKSGFSYTLKANMISNALMIYYANTYLLVEPAVGYYFCDSGILYWRVPDVLLVQTEF